MLGAMPSTCLRADICVYGGTSAGVSAAIAAAREGSSVVIIEPSDHLGGMSSSGIGLVDKGNEATIGGIALEFFKLVGKAYGKPIAWRIEPGTAEAAFERMIGAEPNIRVLRTSSISALHKDGASIESVELDSGLSVSADVFIDASYEGELMAMSGVAWVFGREGSTAYGESLAGIRPQSPKHQFNLYVDPYRTKGLATSGVVAGIQPGIVGDEGAADNSLPAYTYRLCLTKNPRNRRSIEKPPGYDPSQYELLTRYVLAMKAAGRILRLRDLVQLDKLPNGKFDANNRGPISVDYIGGNVGFVTASAKQRAEICKRHEEYLRGLFIYLQTEPRLPQQLRFEAKQFGLAADEYPENSNWPYLIYVREARRMAGEYVVTQANCSGERTVADGIGFASYMIDSHNVRRVVVNGSVRNEGDIQARAKAPYAIPYRSLLPKQTECDNLIVPVCLSATHVAFSSIRMEPVFMILGQSAGVAASMALKERGKPALVDAYALRNRLREVGQIVELPVR
jgi:hypothetical protein